MDVSAAQSWHGQSWHGSPCLFVLKSRLLSTEGNSHGISHGNRTKVQGQSTSAYSILERYQTLDMMRRPLPLLPCLSASQRHLCGCWFKWHVGGSDFTRLPLWGWSACVQVEVLTLQRSQKHECDTTISWRKAATLLPSLLRRLPLSRRGSTRTSSTTRSLCSISALRWATFPPISRTSPGKFYSSSIRMKVWAAPALKGSR